MAKHDIEVDLPARRILNTDLRVTVKSDGIQLGELRISRGTLDWRPGKHRTPIRMRWETFAELLEGWERSRR